MFVLIWVCLCFDFGVWVCAGVVDCVWFTVGWFVLIGFCGGVSPVH